MRMLMALVGLMTALALPLTAGAAPNYPTKPVRVIVGFGAGGLADITVRVVGQKLSELLGQQVVIDNRPGAGGIVAAETVAHAPADGYTLLVFTNGTAVSKALFKSLPFDPVTDFTPVSTLAFFDILILTKSNSPMKTLGDLLKTARDQPGKLNVGTITPGSTQHLSAELFRSMTGLDVTVVPFKGTPDVVTALLGSQIDVAFEMYAPVKSQIDAGAFQALAVSADKRSGKLPNVPTIDEGGVPGYEATSWNAIVAPAKTPADIVELLNKQINVAVNTPEVRAKLLDLGIKAQGGTPADLAQLLDRDITRWTAVIKASGIEQQ